MNDFVNPQHRGVDLPAGYKDLMEVLDRKNKGVHGSEKAERSPVVENFANNGLLHVEHFVDLLLNSRSERPLISFFAERRLITFALFKEVTGLKAAFCFKAGDLVLERTVREIFAEAGLIPSSEKKNPDTGHQALVYPVPLARSALLKLIEELLRRAYGISESDALSFFVRV
jgi:hypothetical protein